MGSRLILPFASLLLIINAALGFSESPPAIPLYGIDRIIFACDEDYPPFSYLENTQLKGFDVDFVDAIAREYKVTTSMVAKNWAEVLEDLRAGRVDAAVCAIWTNDRTADFAFTAPYVTDYYTVFSRPNADISDSTDLRGKRLAILRGDAAIEAFVIPNGLGDGMKTTSTFTEALNLVVNGAADYTIAPLSLGNHAIDSAGFKGLLATGRALFPVYYRFAVRAGNTRLLFMLNDAIARINRAPEIEDMHQQWQVFDTLGEKNKKTASPVFIIIVVFLVGLSGILALWTATLQFRVDEETKRLTKERSNYIRMLDALPFGLSWKVASQEGENAAALKLRSQRAVDDGEVSDAEQAILEHGKTIPVIEKFEGSDGEMKWERISRIPLLDDNGNLNGVLKVIENCTEEKYRCDALKTLTQRIAEKDNAIRELNVTDPLTHLFTRQYIYHWLSELADAFNRYGRIFSLVRVQLRDLDELASTKGYSERDLALKEVSEIIRSCLRQGDGAGRVGGGTILVILPKAGAAMAEKIAMAMDAQLAQGVGRFGRYNLGHGEYAGQDISTLTEFAQASV